MSFPASIVQAAHAPDTCNNTLSDGRIVCHYHDVPAVLASIDQYLQELGIPEEDCLAIECRNSVPGALMILSVLKNGMGCCLLPPSHGTDTLPSIQPMPHFCQHRVIVKDVPRERSGTWNEHPSRFLAVERGPSTSQERTTPFDPRGMIVFRSSGSLGDAKSVVHAQDRFFGNVQNCVRRYQCTREDRVSVPIPIFHSYGMGTGLLLAVLAGASVDLQENTNLVQYLERERRFRPTMACVTPNLCEMLLRWKKTRTPYRVVVTSGQRIREDAFHAFDALCGHRLVNQYGSSEMGAVACCHVGDPSDVRGSTIGHPMEGVSLRIEGPDPDTLSGALYCRHPFGFVGYVDGYGQWLHRAAEWHRTGDMARRGERGGIEIVGREDNSVNRRGFLVALSEVEQAMEQLDGISQVVVVKTRIEGIEGPKMVACCVPRIGSTMTGAQILSATAKRLPSYAVPNAVLLLRAFPLLPGGKADQQTLLTLAEQSLTEGGPVM